MSEQGYRPTSLRSIVIGILIAAVLLVMLCSISSMVKLAGAALLFIPEKLGIIQQISRHQVVNIDPETKESRLVFSGPGAFAIYTSDHDLLVATDELSDKNAKPWLAVTQDSSGEKLEVSYVRRGLRPYDTPLASGRPIFTFEIPEAGGYSILHPTSEARIFLVPDYTTGKERTIVVLYAIQIALVGYPLLRTILRRYHVRQAQLAAWQTQSRARGDALFRTARGEKQTDTDDLWRSKL